MSLACNELGIMSTSIIPSCAHGSSRMTPESLCRLSSERTWSGNHKQIFQQPIQSSGLPQGSDWLTGR